MIAGLPNGYKRDDCDCILGGGLPVRGVPQGITILRQGNREGEKSGTEHSK